MRALRRSQRLLVPLALGILCLMLTAWLPPLASYVSLMIGFALFLDAGLTLMPTTGGMRDHRQ